MQRDEEKLLGLPTGKPKKLKKEQTFPEIDIYLYDAEKYSGEWEEIPEQKTRWRWK